MLNASSLPALVAHRLTWGSFPPTCLGDFDEIAWMWNMCRETGIWLVMLLMHSHFQSWWLRLHESAESGRFESKDPSLMSVNIVRPLLVPTCPWWLLWYPISSTHSRVLLNIFPVLHASVLAKGRCLFWLSHLQGWHHIQVLLVSHGASCDLSPFFSHPLQHVHVADSHLLLLSPSCSVSLVSSSHRPLSWLSPGVVEDRGGSGSDFLGKLRDEMCSAPTSLLMLGTRCLFINQNQ